MKRSPTVEALVQRSVTKARAIEFAAHAKAHAEATVAAHVERYRPEGRAAAGEALRNAIIAHNAKTDPLAEACALQAASRRLVPDAACPKASAEALSKSKRRVA